MIAAYKGRRIYLDTNVFIYALEGFPKYALLASETLAAIETGEITAATSELSVAEAMVHPYRNKQAGLLALYNELLQSRPGLEVVPISRSVLMRSAEIRGTMGSKLPDAIHIATAEHSGSEFHFTADLALKVTGNVKLVPLDSLLIPKQP